MISGATRLEHVRANADAMDLELRADGVAAVNNILDSRKLYFPLSEMK